MLSRRLPRRLAQPSAAVWASARALHATARNHKVHNIKSAYNFWTMVKDQLRVLVDCSAAWCGPCKAIAPVLDKLSMEARFAGKVHFVKFEVDELHAVAQELCVRSMPTFVSFRDGLLTGFLIGADPKKLETAVEELAED